MPLKVDKPQVEKLLEKINIDEMKPSARKYPAIILISSEKPVIKF